MNGLSRPLDNDSKSKNASTHARAVTRRLTADSEGAFQSVGVQQNAGNLAVQRLFKSGTLQAKLSISRPDDPYEREADRVADDSHRAHGADARAQVRIVRINRLFVRVMRGGAGGNNSKKERITCGPSGRSECGKLDSRFGCWRAAPS